MANFWRIFASSVFSEWRADIQSATAENRRGENDRRKKKEETTGPKYNVRICYTGRPLKTEMLGRNGSVIKPWSQS